MPSSTSRRSARPRSSRGQPPQSDAVVVALTAQVFICILLLILASVVKKIDEAGFGAVKQQYDILISDPDAGVELPDGLTDAGGLQRVFAALENAISSIVQRFAGTPPEAAPDAGEPVPGPDDEPPDRMPEPGDTAEPQQVVLDFDYDYLGAADLVQLGQGGAFPVSTNGEDTALLPAPEGATYAQVVLNCKIKPPVTGVVTSEFSYREHPVTGFSDFHNGIDIAAVEGRDIYAALPGTVVETGVSDIYGNYVLLEHAANLQTFYAHCSSVLAREGDVVRQGERIALVGQTGVSTGPHLHFSVIVDDQYTDPYWVLKDNIRLVDAAV